MKINADNLHQEDSLIKRKAEITSIVNTLNKIIIARDVYENYASKFYDDRHVEFYNPDFNFFIKQRLEELEHPGIITEWKNNMDKST